MKVHLVDGTYELFRAHFGAPPATGPRGNEVGATRGLLRSLRALLREDGVTHVAVAFDHVIESFRNELFAGYKTAAGVPEALLAQFPVAEEAARALGLVVWPMVEFEADDALATAAARFAALPEVEQVLVCTPDKDLAQCVRGTRVVGLDRMRRRVIDEEGVRARFGVAPASIPDWLALVGDAADGIPGVPRWGEKSASALLGRYGRLESIPDWLALVGDAADGIPGVPRWGEKSASVLLGRYGHLESIPDGAGAWDVGVRGAAALADNLRAHREEAVLYRTLATLRADVPLAEGLDALRWRGPRPELVGPLEELIGETGLSGRR